MLNNKSCRRLICLLCAMLFLLPLLGGCGTQSASDRDRNTVQAKNTDYNFIFVCPVCENEYWLTCIEGMNKADEDFGTHTKVIGPATPDNFIAEMPGYMEQAIAEKPDGIIVYAGIEALKPLIEKATENGIPVLAIDSDAPDSSRVAYVGALDYSLGTAGGAAVAELTGGVASVGVLMSSFSAIREMRVVDAFREQMEDYGIEVVAMCETDAVTEAAEGAVRSMLEQHPEINALFNTANNVTAAGHVKKELGLDELVLVGFDDTEENCRLVAEGVIDTIIVTPVEKMGYQSVKSLREYVDKGSLPREYYDIGCIRVTENNIDSYSNLDSASNGAGKLVRVGYYDSEAAFQTGYGDSERKSGYAYEYYQELSKLTGWQYEYVYGTRTEIMKQLINGDVDIVAGIHKTDTMNSYVLLSELDMGIAGSDLSFAVTPKRHDLLTELNYAMKQIDLYTPDIPLLLNQKYYSKAPDQTFSDRERDWLSAQKAIRIGYLRDNLPLSGKNADGTLAGVAAYIFEMLGDYMHTVIEPVDFETVTEMEKALGEGEIDAAFPAYSDQWINETKGLIQTEPIISDRAMLVYRGAYSDDILDRIAFNVTGVACENILAVNYPNAELVGYKSRAETTKAVQHGDERCMVGSSLIIQQFLSENAEFNSLNIAYLNFDVDFCLIVDKDSYLLSGILNKAIRGMNSAELTNEMIRTSGNVGGYSIKQVMRDYSVQIISALSVFFVLLVLAVIAWRRKVRRFNITQAKSKAALEDALERANEASQAKTIFFSSMSHDIRTPMNAIVGMVTVANRHLDDMDRIKDCLDKIELSSRHLLTLINNLLDVSKIESGKLVLNSAVFSLRDMFTSLINIMRTQMKEKDLEFCVSVSGVEHEKVRGDEVRLNQVFINLLSNAVKYTPSGGKISVSIKEEAADEGHIMLTYVVQDTGIGMSPEFMETMYETFSRASDTRINKIQGTGLGLAIVKEMVDLMGGTIDCESEVNKGTRFTVKIKLPTAEELDECSLPDISVLLVDDDECYLESTADMLESMGAAADTARSRSEAEALVRAHAEAGRDYDVIIVDWRMPDGDGYEIISELKSMTAEKTRAILASAYEWPEADNEAQKSCVSDYMSKPLFRSYLYEKLMGVLSEREDSTVDYEIKSVGKMRILVAEDNDLNWEISSELLEIYSIMSERAENGQICLDMLRAAEPNYFNMVLMDVQMPVLGGLDATRLIRQEAREDIRNIPIIAMTADAFAEDIAACREAGMNGYVSKPVDINKLQQEIIRVMGAD